VGCLHGIVAGLGDHAALIKIGNALPVLFLLCQVMLCLLQPCPRLIDSQGKVLRLQSHQHLAFLHSASLIGKDLLDDALDLGSDFCLLQCLGGARYMGIGRDAALCRRCRLHRNLALGSAIAGCAGAGGKQA